MIRYLTISALLLLSRLTPAQFSAVQNFMTDSSLVNASVSICIKDLSEGKDVIRINPLQSLIPASVMKLITSGVALELLGPGYTFRTTVGYTGSLNKRTGRLSGDIVITGGGDPAIGSGYFSGHYGDFIGDWIGAIKNYGIRIIDGRIITDDSRYDYFPVPAGWQWEDIGNYYGAGVYGLSAFDNMVGLHFRTGCDSTPAVFTGISPPDYKFRYRNFLMAGGSGDNGYVYSSPYSDNGWITGTIPAWQDDFVLKASMADPPMFISRLVSDRLKADGIKTRLEPSTTRLTGHSNMEVRGIISENVSPPLAEIIKVLNHESVNMFAETLVKEIGRNFGKSGSSSEGLNIIREFLQNAGISLSGIFIEDGSGLSPGNAISAEGLTDFLIYMKTSSRNFSEYFESLPEAGREGTLKYYFRDDAFISNLRAKSGSMNRVRCYAGYFRTVSGKDMAFAILVNNYAGPATALIHLIEQVLKDVILRS